VIYRDSDGMTLTLTQLLLLLTSLATLSGGGSSVPVEGAVPVADSSGDAEW